MLTSELLYMILILFPNETRDWVITHILTINMCKWICTVFLSILRKDKDQKDEMFTEYYIMHGAQVGHTSLVAEAHPSDGVVIRSQARPVEVSKLC